MANVNHQPNMNSRGSGNPPIVTSQSSGDALQSLQQAFSTFSSQDQGQMNLSLQQLLGASQNGNLRPPQIQHQAPPVQHGQIVVQAAQGQQQQPQQQRQLQQHMMPQQQGQQQQLSLNWLAAQQQQQLQRPTNQAPQLPAGLSPEQLQAIVTLQQQMASFHAQAQAPAGVQNAGGNGILTQNLLTQVLQTLNPPRAKTGEIQNKPAAPCEDAKPSGDVFQNNSISSAAIGDKPGEVVAFSASSASASGEKSRYFPCRARGMPLDHNAKTAYFELPPAIAHGDDLKCTHQLCQEQGVKFQFCQYCDRPVAKRNFRNRHLHIDQAYPDPGPQISLKKRNTISSQTLDAHLSKKKKIVAETKKDSYTIVTSDSSTVPSSNIQSEFSHKAACQIKEEDDAAEEEINAPEQHNIKKAPKQFLKPSRVPSSAESDVSEQKKDDREAEWAELLKTRPDSGDLGNTVLWLERVLATSDAPRNGPPSDAKKDRFHSIATEYFKKYLS